MQERSTSLSRAIGFVAGTLANKIGLTNFLGGYEDAVFPPQQSTANSVLDRVLPLVPTVLNLVIQARAAGNASTTERPAPCTCKHPGSPTQPPTAPTDAVMRACDDFMEFNDSADGPPWMFLAFRAVPNAKTPTDGFLYKGTEARGLIGFTEETLSDMLDASKPVGASPAEPPPPVTLRPVPRGPYAPSEQPDAAPSDAPTS